MGGEVLARYRWELGPIANLNLLSLWFQSSCRTHSLSRSAWSFPDIRPGLSLWTTSPAHSHNTPLAEWTQKAQTEHPMLVCGKDKCALHAEHYLIMRHTTGSCFGAFLEHGTLTAWTELHSRLVSRYRSARFSSSLNLPSACQSKVSPGINNSQTKYCDT